jgi:hypothetical protein
MVHCVRQGLPIACIPYLLIPCPLGSITTLSLNYLLRLSQNSAVDIATAYSLDE